MDITETLYVTSRDAWRDWLAAHHHQESEIWLVSYRKETGWPSVPYNDAVEEALCFGWIDSTRKRLDDKRYAQRYTPRRSGSSFSQINKERLARLLKQDKVISSVKAELDGIAPDGFAIPDDIQQALRAEEGAWSFFQSTSPSYQRIRAAYVDHARDRPAEFEKRLQNLVEKSAKGRQFGYGIEGYY